MSLVPKTGYKDVAPVALVPGNLDIRAKAYIVANPAEFTGLSESAAYTKLINDALNSYV